jgi:hypothetical protein
MEKLRKIVFYLNKCIREMPEDVLPSDPNTTDEDIEIILTAIGNILCNLAWSLGCNKETFQANIMDLWNQRETAGIEEEKDKILN